MKVFLLPFDVSKNKKENIDNENNGECILYSNVLYNYRNRITST